MRAFIFGIILASAAMAVSPCDSAMGWRESLCAFAKKNLVHFAWGYEHGIRDYQLALKLAQEEGVTVDEEVLFAAGLLHDIGGFAPYEKAGVDHALRSTQVVDPVLEASGFPMVKSNAVKRAILTHSYYDPARPETPEAIALHDADTLDFLGAISIARLLAIAGRERGLSDPKTVIKLLTQFQKDLPGKLYGGVATKELGRRRSEELGSFLRLLDEETFSLGLPLHG
ncbi:MAG: HD domain-containing protein [Deltaproteobacteria bacterium]|nr:HD domain-containing protein [Deltaproteobacteria bacterium]MBI3296504.1 HD domain-containing protein [Deltaproteobacteria bacterium]